MAARLERENRLKIDLFKQKRSTLERQVDSLRLKIVEENIDLESLKLRGEDVQKLFEKYLEFSDELALLDPTVDHQETLIQIQNNYYAVMSQLKIKLQNKVVNNNDPPSASISQQQVKLPDIPLPKFNGKYEEWFNFKDAFIAIIDTNDKINEVSKLFALKNCLIDDAKGKLDVYREIPGEYVKAWKYLEKSYEVKRLIADSHLRAIDNLQKLEKETTDGLTKLVDSLMQHRTCLERLGIEIHPTVAVHILQSKLPKYTLTKWEESINLEELPSLDNLIQFINRIAVCTSRYDKRPNSSHSDNNSKQPQSKKIRPNSQKPSHQVLTTDNSSNCPACQKNKHPLYACDDFKNQNLKRKYEIIKRANVCKICLRVHKNSCTYHKCKECGENHNILLHPRDLKKDATKVDAKEKTQSSSTEN